MAFLFKKKHHDKAAAAAAAAGKAGSVDSSTLQGSNTSMQSGPNGGRGSKERNDAYSSQTPTPTGSVSNSIHSFQGHAPSPDRAMQHMRRGQGSEDVSEPVSFAFQPRLRVQLAASPHTNGSSTSTDRHSSATVKCQSCKHHKTQMLIYFHGHLDN